MPDTTNTNKLQIPSKLREAFQLQQEIIKLVRERNFSREVVFAVRLALDEALSNAIRHGNRSDPSKFVTVEYVINDQQVQIQVHDQGVGFNPDSLPDPTLDENLTRPNGRGVMLIKAYMTQVTFGDNGRCITMVKHRDCRLPQRN